MSKPAKHCNHILTNGEFCQSPALRKDVYCYFHRSARERYKRQLRHARQHKPLQLRLLEDLRSVQLAVSDVLNALLAGLVDHKTAGLLLYGLQTAASTARDCDYSLYDCDESVVAYTEYEERTLEEEVQKEIRQEERAAARAAHKSAKTTAATASAPHPESEIPVKHPATPDPGTVLPEKKPATRVSQKEFWNVVGHVARQNATAAARQLERQLQAADQADEHLAAEEDTTAS